MVRVRTDEATLAALQCTLYVAVLITLPLRLRACLTPHWHSGHSASAPDQLLALGRDHSKTATSECHGSLPAARVTTE
eukprot:3541076-Amphidinium_carterae.1